MKTTTKPKVGDRLRHFGGKLGTIQAINKGIAKYKIVWDGEKSEVYSQKEFSKWCELVIEEIKEQPCSPSSTSAQELVQVSPLLDYNSEDLPLLDCVSMTTIAAPSCSCDTPTLPSTQTLQGLQLVIPSVEFSSLQPVPLANPSQSRVKDSEPVTAATISPPLLERSNCSSASLSPQLDLSILRSKMPPDYYLAHIAHVWGKEPISQISYGSSISSGTMSNDKQAQDTLAVPGADSACSWLVSPGSLSSSQSRVLGQSKLEASLKKLRVLERGECLNPHWIEYQFSLLMGWSNPLDLRPTGNGITRARRAALGNCLDPRVAAVALQKILYLNSLVQD